MSISLMGSVSSYTKTLKLQTQWNLKQQTGDYSSHKKSLDEWVNTAQQSLKRSLSGTPEHDEETSKKLNDIMQKVYAGKKLTQKEKQFLKAKDPQTYEKLRSIEHEQKSYEQKLRLCKTKEEVQRLKMTQLASSLATVNEVSHNPHISASKKLEICMQEKIRCDRLEESTRNFVKSGEYNNLPTEAEQAKAQKEEREKLEAALKPKDEQVEEKPKTDEEQSKVTTETEQTPVQPNTESSQPAPQSTQDAPDTTSTQAVTKPTVKVQAASTKPAKSSAPADTSPEQRKVRRARRQAASAAYKAVATPAPSVATPSVNINA